MSRGNTKPMPIKSIDYLDVSEYDLVVNALRLFKAHIADSTARQRNVIILELLTRWRVRVHGLVAALILPLVGTNQITEDELHTYFGERAVATAQVAYKHIYVAVPQKKMERVFAAESLRELYKYAFFNIEAVLICVADHLAQASTLSGQDIDIQQLWGQKNNDIYSPLLSMLGMLAYKRDLGNLALAVTSLPYYNELEQCVLRYYERTDRLFEGIKQALSSSLVEVRVDAEINLKYIAAIDLHWRATEAKQRGENVALNDTVPLCVDVVLGTELDCYLVLGVIHNQWRPAYHHSEAGTGWFHDYIAIPHYNGYRCLNTTILYDRPGHPSNDGLAQVLVEFRLLTYEMQQINEYGIVAAMDNPLPVKNVWWSDIALAEVINPNTPHDTNAAIAVFAPNGEIVYPLQANSTVIDFAFCIHSSLGPYANGFWVNGKQVTENQRLALHDLVEITYDAQYPNVKPEWIQYAHTPLARANIQKFLKSRQGTPHRGRKLIDKVLERENEIYRMRFPEEKIERSLGKIARHHDCATLESLYMNIMTGDISPDEVVATMVEEELVGHVALENGDDWAREQIRIARCWMQAKEEQKWDRASRVVPGVDIVGRKAGNPDAPILIVHRSDCQHAPVGEEAIPLRWAATTTLREAAEMMVVASTRSGVVGAILNAIYALGNERDEGELLLHRFHADVQDSNIVINFIVDSPSVETIHNLQEKLFEMKRAKEITDINVWQLYPGQKMLLAGKLDRRKRMKYTLRQIRDRSMFFGRENEIYQIIEAVQSGEMFIVLYGQKRIGKTSLLYQLAENLLPGACPDVLPILLDANSIAPINTITFLLGLSEAVKEKLSHLLKRPEDRKGLELQEADLKENPFVEFAAWVKRVQKRLRGTKLLFMIDEFTRAEEACRAKKLDKNFFNQLQWLVGKENVGFLLCVHDTIYHFESRSWGMMQRGRPIRLDTLDHTAAAHLVQQPSERFYKFPPKIVERILSLTNCHPYYIHAICLALSSRMADMPHDEVTQDDLMSAVTIVLRDGDHYFNHFRAPLDERSWVTLKIIAHIAGDANAWVSREEVHRAMERFGYKTDNWELSNGISELYRAGVIDANTLPSKVIYRIPIGLFQFWLLKRTHPLVLRDMQPKD